MTASPDTVAKLPPAELINLTPDIWTKPFWDATAEHRLVIPRCGRCGLFRLPPSAFCWNCQAQEVEWIAHDGTGTIYSFTVIHHPLLPDLADSVPYVPAVVELPETNGCRLVGALTKVELGAVRIGMDVELVWRDVRDGETVPTFRPTGS